MAYVNYNRVGVKRKAFHTGAAQIRKFDFEEWSNKKKHYPQCACGRRFVITRGEDQSECLFCIGATERYEASIL